MKEKTKILLTGASGTVGFEVLTQLNQRAADFEITVFDVKSKKTVRKFRPFEKQIEIVYGDIANDHDVRKVCSNKDFVIHLAALIPPYADEYPELADKVNTLGTENLVRNLEELSPQAFLLYSSSISVYGDRINDPNIRVNDPIEPSEGDEYAKTKIKAEQIITDSQLDWSIFRLAAIMGNHKISKLMFHMPLDTSLEIATPEDTGRAFVLAIAKKDLLSKRVFNLGGGASCRTTYAEFLSRSFILSGLGEPNFPEKAFAEQNFHCGYYVDGDELEEILNFRKDTIENYYASTSEKTPFVQKIITSIFKKQIKKMLLKNSEPYTAYNHDDIVLKQRFFNS